jgi:hypothetical protein
MYVTVQYNGTTKKGENIMFEFLLRRLKATPIA